MMRESSSVRLIWSFGSGPSTGGAGGLPPGFLPVVAVLASRAASLASCSARSRSYRSFARASIFARASASLARRFSRKASSSEIDMPSGTSRPHPPPRRAPANPPPRPSVAPRACSRVPKKARCDGWRWRGSSCRRGRSFPSSAPPSRARAAAPERTALDLLEKAPSERGDRVVVWVVVGGDVAERHAVVSRPLQLAARKHPRRVAVNQNPQQHPGMVRRRAGAAIGADHAAKIEPVDHLDDKARQVFLGKPLVDRRRQKERRLAINVPEVAHRQQTTIRRINGTILANVSAVGLSPTGC